MSLTKMACGTSTTTDLISNVNGLIDSGVAYESAPTGFDWPVGLPEVKAAKVGGTYQCNIKPEDLIDFSVFTNTQYVDINRPDSSGDGLSWATAEKGIGHAIDNAISSGVPTRILVRGGVYPRAYSVGNSNLPKNLNAPISIESVYGDVLTGTFDELSYTKTAGQTYVYEATRSNVSCLIDPSASTKRASGRLYRKVGSITECNLKAGSFFTTNTILYVHAFNSSQVTNLNTLAPLNAYGAHFKGNHDIYLSGIKSIGGLSSALRVEEGVSNTVVANKSSFLCGAAGASDGVQTPRDGVEILGCKIFAAFDCDASLNSKDGFNLHIQGAVKPSLLTVRCTGYDNGQIINSAQSCNGITAHDGLKAIDIGGEWLGSVGTNAGHVGDDTQVWHFGSIAGQSAGDAYNGGSINYGAFGVWSGAAKMWLDNCTDYSSKVGVLASGTANAYLRNHSGTGLRTGNISTY